MAAGLGFKTFTTGEVLTAADTNGYLMQGVLVFASSAARASAITAPQEGQYSYLKDTNSTEYYDGAAWIAAPIGDITGVTAGTGISGGGTSGTVTITNSMATEITAKGDLIAGTGSATFDNLPVGTNGQTLVADSTASTGLKWATPASGGGWTTLETITLSGTSVTTSATLSGYKQIVLQLSNGAASVNASMRLRVNGITTSYYGVAQSGGGTALNTLIISNTGGIDLDNNPLQTGTNANIQFTFPNYDVSGTSKVCFWNGWALNVAHFGTAMTNGLTAAMTSITYTTVAATATLSGTLYVYGVK
jgi:hypothetical protein